MHVDTWVRGYVCMWIRVCMCVHVCVYVCVCVHMFCVYIYSHDGGVGPGRRQWRGTLPSSYF